MTRTCPHCHAPFLGDRRSTFCPDCRDTSAPWRVDEAALERACAHLGIDVPVRVRRMKGRTLNGRYHGIKLLPEAPRDPAVFSKMDDDALNALMFHKLTIAVRMTPEAASRTLWHELTHAAQYERDPDGYVEGYAAELRLAKRVARAGMPYAKAYRAISFEIEAKANEGLHYSLFPLTRANRRVSLPPLPTVHHRVVSAHDGRLVLGPRYEEYERRSRAEIAEAKRRLAAR